MVKSTDLQIPGDIAPVPIQTLRWGGGGGGSGQTLR